MYRIKGGLGVDVWGNLDLDGFGVLGDIGWYCVCGIFWVNDYEMLILVIGYLGVFYNDKGVIVSCGVMFVWFDGCIVMFMMLFNMGYVMKLLVVGVNGSLEMDDFMFLVEVE